VSIRHVGDGTVTLIAGGGKIYTDMAARFCRSEKGLEEILATPYDKDLVQRIVNSGHTAATEFDYFIFGIEGYARVTEVQLVRKRLASYLIKSGRVDKGGKRSFDVVVPKNINDFGATHSIHPGNIFIPKKGRYLSDLVGEDYVDIHFDAADLLMMTEAWYNEGIKAGQPEEDLRYMKQQATEFKCIIGMNAHALLDWWKIRTCNNAQTEIKDLAWKMLNLSRRAACDLFLNAGPSCKALGYCPENAMQHKDCKGKVFTQDEAREILQVARAQKIA
jgi:thymidylate synthase (FAD)